MARFIGGEPRHLEHGTTDEIFGTCRMMQEAGIQMHIHTNGDEASEVVLDALEAAARKHPWPGARHVLQHAQMMGTALFARAAELGGVVIFFASKYLVFRQQHTALTIEDRTRRGWTGAVMANRAGVHLAGLPDAPVRPHRLRSSRMVRGQPGHTRGGCWARRSTAPRGRGAFASRGPENPGTWAVSRRPENVRKGFCGSGRQSSGYLAGRWRRMCRFWATVTGGHHSLL